MASVNKAIILGNLGQDPEVRYTADGSAVTNLSIATTEFWTDKATGEKQEKTEWHRVVLFKRQAEVAGEFLSKGSSVYIEGQLQTRKWTDKEGIDRYTTEIVGRVMQMLGGRSGDRKPGPDEGGMSYGAAPSAGNNVGDPYFNEDIPF